MLDIDACVALLLISSDEGIYACCPNIEGIWTYDVLMRMCLIVWCVACTGILSLVLEDFLQTAEVDLMSP